MGVEGLVVFVDEVLFVGGAEQEGFLWLAEEGQKWEFVFGYLERGLVFEQVLEFVLEDGLGVDLEAVGDQLGVLLVNVDENLLGKVFNSPDAGLQIMPQFQFLIFSSFQCIFNFVQLIL